MKISTKIKLALRSLVMNAGSVETDKATLQYDGDELAVGAEVFVESEGEMVAAEDGEYVAEDKTIVVAEGKVTEIRIKEQPEEEVEISAAKQKFNSIKSAFEATYEEKIEKIAEAIRVLGYDAWVVEAADSYCVAEVWNDVEGSYHYVRFDVAWDEEGNVTVSNPEEVKSAFVPVEEENVENFEEEPKPADEPENNEEPKTTDEKVEELSIALGDIREGIEQLTNAIAAIVTRVEEVENKIKGLEEPAAEPAEEGEETEVKASRLSYLRK